MPTNKGSRFDAIASRQRSFSRNDGQQRKVGSTQNQLEGERDIGLIDGVRKSHERVGDLG